MTEPCVIMTACDRDVCDRDVCDRDKVWPQVRARVSPVPRFGALMFGWRPT